jgi:AcrR family transcriptional regulator
MTEIDTNEDRRCRGRPQIRPTMKPARSFTRPRAMNSPPAATPRPASRRRAGVSTKTLYRLIPNKAALLASMVSNRLDRLVCELNLRSAEHTKDEKRAKVLSKPVMMKFERILAQAEALRVEHPVRTELTEAEIKQIADYFYAHQLGADEGLRADGVGDEPLFAGIHRQLTEAGGSSSKARSKLKRLASACQTG